MMNEFKELAEDVAGTEGITNCESQVQLVLRLGMVLARSHWGFTVKRMHSKGKGKGQEGRRFSHIHHV